MGFNSGFKGLNGLVRFAERRNMVSARVPSHFKRSLQQNRRDVQESDSAKGHCECVQKLKEMWLEKKALKGDNTELYSDRGERRRHLTSLPKRNKTVTFICKVT